ncbi:MAG: efflux RND transporter periplasmic adaptor subunit [Ignavibacteria bacterium]|jgi:Cu(I)/Ag(I) efflux system membrane fusion protein/cobalt-zinc-cadmium efflux system membrane fusion protein
MNKRKIVLIIVLIIIIAVPVYLMFFQSSSDNNMVSAEEKQLYTCGMHPEIISEEPGLCPICEMNLTPIMNEKSKSGERKILYWQAPMDPNEIYDSPGKSRMGMDLVPVYDDEANASGIVNIDPEVQQNMNIKTETVNNKKLSSTISTNGVLTIDETKEYLVTTKVSGWVEKLYVNYTGQKVDKGQKLMEIYSPELVSAQQELITALSYKNTSSRSSIESVRNSGDELVENAIRKLRLLDIAESEIDRLVDTKNVTRTLTLYASNSGTVLHKNVVEGEKIMVGTPLLRIADLSNLWLTADIYEFELSKIQIGSSASIEFNFLQGKTFNGKISFIYPTIEPVSRTAKIRIDVKNVTGELKPDMYANVTIEGNDLGEFPIVAENAVIRSGDKDLVILDIGNGKFKPVEIKLGGYSDGYYQALEGLTEGNKVVTSAQFLIDSESNLKAAISQFQSTTKDEKHGMKEVEDEMTMEEHDHSSSIVHEGVINVVSIDKNQDGKLFECPMDWNVITDEDGRCPVCNMYLKEYTIDEVKSNLEKNGFEYK